MQLIVWVRGLGANAGVVRQEVNTFADQDKVAAHIARAIRNWIRTVPVRNGGTRLDLKVLAEWKEDKVQTLHMTDAVTVQAPRPKRKRARAKKGK